MTMYERLADAASEAGRTFEQWIEAIERSNTWVSATASTSVTRLEADIALFEWAASEDGPLDNVDDRRIPRLLARLAALRLDTVRTLVGINAALAERERVHG